jgi:hypothetical protein
MKDLIEQAEKLRNMIRSKRDEIDNPVLVTGILSELDFFIENVDTENE